MHKRPDEFVWFTNDLSRTKEALAKRKADSLKLGLLLGPSKNLRQYPLADKIDKRSIAKLLDVSPSTLYAWLKVRRL